MDPVRELRTAAASHLRSGGAATLAFEAAPYKGSPWGADIWDGSSRTAWQCLSVALDSDAWTRRIRKALSKKLGKAFRVGLFGPSSVLHEPSVLLFADEIEARLLVVDQTPLDQLSAPETFVSACDFIYEKGLRLSEQAACEVLDRNLARAVSEPNKNRKGVRLEIVTAVMLSQVDGYNVISRGVSNRSQQIDVVVNNRNVGGALGRGSLVIAEAKNWSNPVGTTEYFSVYRKLESRYGFAKLGFFVTTDRFTAGVDVERYRDSRNDRLVVTLDGKTLPEVWRQRGGITRAVERAVIDAATR